MSGRDAERRLDRMKHGALRDRDGVWHQATGPSHGNAEWQPIACGEGINLPGREYDHEITCPDCIAAGFKRDGDEEA